MPYFLLLPLSVCSLCMYAGKFCDTVEVVGRNVMSTTSVWNLYAAVRQCLVPLTLDLLESGLYGKPCLELHPICYDAIQVTWYGEQAAQVTNEGFDAAGHAIGGLGLSGGLLGFVFTRNPATLSTGVLFGGALLALNTFSFKIWRQGNSSLPTFSSPSLEELSDPLIGSTSHQQKVLIHCAAMLCFSSYVLISGGNPPPKKLKSSPSVAS
uniref:Peptidase S54 rhomboid domain-containing protein n=1 Tax=Fagus sylvatica TaxID=28930 RepID=A0A2N9FWC6_FAGSY